MRAQQKTRVAVPTPTGRDVRRAARTFAELLASGGDDRQLFDLEGEAARREEAVVLRELPFDHLLLDAAEQLRLKRQREELATTAARPSGCRPAYGLTKSLGRATVAQLSDA